MALGAMWCACYLLLAAVLLTNAFRRLCTGYPDDPVQIRDIVVSPDPPVRGENLTITVLGDALARVKVSVWAACVVVQCSCACRRVHMPTSPSRLATLRSCGQSMTSVRRRAHTTCLAPCRTATQLGYPQSLARRRHPLSCRARDVQCDAHSRNTVADSTW